MLNDVVNLLCHPVIARFFYSTQVKIRSIRVLRVFRGQLTVQSYEIRISHFRILIKSDKD
jgi:hypothetical protein